MHVCCMHPMLADHSSRAGAGPRAMAKAEAGPGPRPGAGPWPARNAYGAGDMIRNPYRIRESSKIS